MVKVPIILSAFLIFRKHKGNPSAEPLGPISDHFDDERVQTLQLNPIFEQRLELSSVIWLEVATIEIKAKLDPLL